jgi:hypothetical protein
VCIFFSANRTRDRGCSKHPVFPTPSDFEERANEDANLGRPAPRDRETILTSLRAQRSNPRLHLRRYGLLRCARNDVEKAGDPLSPHPEEAAKRPSRRARRPPARRTGLPTKQAGNPSGQDVAFCDAAKSSTWALLTGNGNSIGLSVLVHLACKLRSLRSCAPRK